MNGYSSTYVSFLEKRKGTWRKEGEERNYLRDILITVTRKLLNCSFVTFKRKEMYRIRYRKYRLSSKTTFFPSFAVDFRCKETRFHGHKVLRVFLYWLDVPRAGKLRQKKLKLDAEREREREGEGRGRGRRIERKRETAQRSVLCEIILIGILCHFTFLPTFIRRLPRSGKREFQVYI